MPPWVAVSSFFRRVGIIPVRAYVPTQQNTLADEGS